MSEKEVEKEKGETVTLKVTLPTKETVMKALSTMFPGIEVKVEKEKKEGETSEE